MRSVVESMRIERKQKTISLNTGIGIIVAPIVVEKRVGVLCVGCGRLIAVRNMGLVSVLNSNGDGGLNGHPH